MTLSHGKLLSITWLLYLTATGISCPTFKVHYYFEIIKDDFNKVTHGVGRQILPVIHHPHAYHLNHASFQTLATNWDHYHSDMVMVLVPVFFALELK